MLIFQIPASVAQTGNTTWQLSTVEVEFKFTALATAPSQTVPQPRHFGGVQETLYKQLKL